MYMTYCYLNIDRLNAARHLNVVLFLEQHLTFWIRIDYHVHPMILNLEKKTIIITSVQLYERTLFKGIYF